MAFTRSHRHRRRSRPYCSDSDCTARTNVEYKGSPRRNESARSESAHCTRASESSGGVGKGRGAMNGSESVSARCTRSHVSNTEAPMLARSYA